MTALQLSISSTQIQFHAALSLLIIIFVAVFHGWSAIIPTFLQYSVLFCFVFSSVHLMGCKCFMLVAWSHSCSRGWVTRCSLLLCRDNLFPSLPPSCISLPPSIFRVLLRDRAHTPFSFSTTLPLLSP